MSKINELLSSIEGSVAWLIVAVSFIPMMVIAAIFAGLPQGRI